VSKGWRLAGTAALVGVLAWRLKWGEVASAFASLDRRFWLAALGVYLAVQVVSSLRWLMLARALGLGGGLGRFTAWYFIGMFFNLLLPTSVGGDVVRAWYLWGADGPEPAAGRKTAAALSVLIDRANGLAVLVVVGCAGLALYPGPLEPWLTACVAGLGAATLLGLALLPLLPRLRQRLPRHPRLLQVLDGALVCLRHRRLMLAVTALSLVVQLVSVLICWLLARGLGLDVPAGYCCVLTAVVSVLTLLPVSVNGMGLREAGTALLLQPLGVGTAQAVTLGMLTFAVQAAASLGGGLCYLAGRFPRFEAPAAAGASGAVEVRADAHPLRCGPDQGRAREPSAAA
jgi:uncharacterized membrane protein YbhN (UPF0104 family)